MAATQVTCGPTARAGDDPVDATQPPNDVSQVPDADTECGEATFDVTETQEVFEVPPNVYYMHVKVWGSGGNGEGACTFDDGGIGGYAEAVFSVTPGDPLIIIVGAPGSASHQGDDVVRFGFGSSGGGGLSGVFRGPDILDEFDGAAGKTESGGLVVIHFVCAIPPVL